MVNYKFKIDKNSLPNVALKKQKYEQEKAKLPEKKAQWAQSAAEEKAQSNTLQPISGISAKQTGPAKTLIKAKQVAPAIPLYRPPTPDLNSISPTLIEDKFRDLQAFKEENLPTKSENYEMLKQFYENENKKSQVKNNTNKNGLLNTAKNYLADFSINTPTKQANVNSVMPYINSEGGIPIAFESPKINLFSGISEERNDELQRLMPYLTSEGGMVPEQTSYKSLSALNNSAKSNMGDDKKAILDLMPYINSEGGIIPEKSLKELTEKPVDNLTLGSRVSNGLVGVGKKAGATLGVFKDLAAQDIENVNSLSQVYDTYKMLEKQAAQIKNQHINDYYTLKDNKEYQSILKKMEDCVAIIDSVRNQSASIDTDAMQKYGEANQFTAKALEELTPGWRTLGSALISTAQNVMMLPSAVISPNLPLAGMSTMAAADRAYQLASEGNTARSSLGRGIVSGGIEAFTEKVSLDHFIKMVNSGGKGIVINMLKQSGIEASEEAVSYTLNYAADKFANDPNAYFSVDEALQSAVEGGLSGLFFGIGGTALNAVNPAGTNANTNTQDNQELSNEPVQQLSNITESADNVAQSETSTWKERLIHNENQTFLQSKANPTKKYVIPKSENINTRVSENGEVVVNFNGLDGVNPKDYRDFLKAYVDENLITHFDPATREMTEYKPITIKSDGSNVVITQTGVKDFSKKIRSGGEKTKANVYSFFVLDKLIENAKLVETKENSKGKENSFSYYESKLLLNGKEYSVKLNVKNTKIFDEYYYHSLEDIEIGPANDASQDVSPGRHLIVTDDPITSTNTSINHSTQNINNYSTESATDNNKGLVQSGNVNIVPASTKLLDFKTSKDINNSLETQQKKLAKLKSKYELEPVDSEIIKLLAEGKLLPENIPSGINVEAIKEIYPLAKEVHNLKSTVKEHKKTVREQYNNLARESLADSEAWKDKKIGKLYSTEIMERNFEDIIKNKEKAAAFNNTYFAPVHANEANATRLKKQLREKIKTLKLSDKKKYKVQYNADGETIVVDVVNESALVQLYGEGKITEADLKSAKADVEKINNAVAEFRSIYDSLAKQANESLVRNGYDPVNPRKNYFPHFTENMTDSVLQKFGSIVGINVNSNELPTNIAGITHTFRPGKNWVGNFLQRTGETTEYDSVKGLDIYLERVCDVIYHTDDIQRLRALEREIRYKYSDEGIQEQINNYVADEDMAPEEKAGRIEELYKDYTISKFPHLVTELRSYTDTLAGKKYNSDRNTEHDWGRFIYDVSISIENRYAANAIAMNPGSWLTNFIPITQISGIVRTTSLLNAVKDTIYNEARNDGIKGKSDFLTNREGSVLLSRTNLRKVQDLLTSPMQIIDSFTAEVVVRTKYYDNMRNGMTEAEALKDSDVWAARAMADRSKGSLPTYFNAKNPISKLFTMFQLEVNNQYRYFFKDVPRGLGDKGKAVVVYSLVKMFVGAFLYNELYEKLTGRRAAFDPIDIVRTALKDFSDEDKTTYQAAASTTKNIAEEIPFFGGLLGGGRVPVSSAFPDFASSSEAVMGLKTGEMNEKKATSILKKEAIKPLSYLLPPFGGGQIKKAYEGLSTIAEGGSYSYDNNGDPKLQFPVENPTPSTYAKAAIFGKYAIPEAKDYVESNFTSLTTSQTQKYHLAVEAGINYKQYMQALNGCKGIESDRDEKGNAISPDTKAEKGGIGKSASLKKKEMIDSIPNLSKEQKEVLYEANEVSTKLWKEEDTSEEEIKWSKLSKF